MILAGDIGGTNTRLAIFDEKLNLARKPAKFPTGNGRQLESQIGQVLRAHKGAEVDRVCLAIAGPVIDGVSNSTNIGRKFAEIDIRRSIGIDRLVIINDLVANAAGIERLHKSELVTILKGKKHRGNCAIVSPGTGLGEGALIWDGRHQRPIASEGGHSHFAPGTALECELLNHLLKTQSTVSGEDVCSGRGIETLYDFFVVRGSKVSKSFAKKLDKLPVGKRGGLISGAALEKSRDDVAAIEAMDLFVHILGRECASIAVKVFATGGVYLGGGIPPKILPLLKGATFRKAFLTHRVLGELLRDIPVRVILDDDTALEGAALYGLHFL